MRIGIIAGEYPPRHGGIGAYTCILAEHLADAGHSVNILCPTESTNHSSDVRLTSTVHRWDMTVFRNVWQWIKAFQPDVINLQFQTAAFDMSPWIHILPQIVKPVPFVTTFHDLRHPYLFPKAGALRDWVVKLLAQTSNGIILTNNEDAQRLSDHPRRTIIPIGSNILQMPQPITHDDLCARIRAPMDTPIIGHFGLLNQSKGVHTLIDALAQLHAQGTPAHLLIIGGLGTSDPTNKPYAEEITLQIAGCNLSDAVHMLGYLEDESEIGGILAACDAVALPYTDGASFRRGSLMAALQYGCAIVTSAPSIAIPELRHGENMLLHSANDSDTLAKALKTVLNDPNYVARLRAGATTLSKQFSWQSIAQAQVNFFTQVIESRT
jgi:polysaccharide biosynthesis protein PslF